MDYLPVNINNALLPNTSVYVKGPYPWPPQLKILSYATGDRILSNQLCSRAYILRILYYVLHAAKHNGPTSYVDKHIYYNNILYRYRSRHIHVGGHTQ